MIKNIIFLKITYSRNCVIFAAILQKFLTVGNDAEKNAHSGNVLETKSKEDL